MTLNNKVKLLPKEQLTWLLLIKNMFKRTLNSNTKSRKELIDAVESKANERGFNELKSLLNRNELVDYFKN